jgi:hypothetical protein
MQKYAVYTITIITKLKIMLHSSGLCHGMGIIPEIARTIHWISGKK